MPIPTDSDLTLNDWYEITAVDTSPGAPSLPLGTVLQAGAETAGKVEPTNAGGKWLADFNGAGYGTTVTGLEFVRHSNPNED
jgi:hypothetical protein